MDPPQPDPEDWLVDRTNNQLVLIARNSIGRYTLANPAKLFKASQFMAPEAIQAIVAGPPNRLCRCPTGVERPRCNHKFTFNEVREVRGERYSSNDHVALTVERLKALQPRRTVAGLAGVATLTTPRTIVYYVGQTRVCRRFFMACNGFSKRKVDKISNLVRGIAIVQAIRPLAYNPRTTKAIQATNFLRTFFGDQAQSSAPGHRYFPVNMSYYYIYMHIFWPWWKDDRGHWPVLLPRAPAANPELVVATSSGATLTTPASIQNFLLQFCNDYESQLAEEEKFDDNEGLFDWESGEPLSATTAEMATMATMATMAMDVSELDYTAEAEEAVRLLQREPGFPSYSTFVRALKDPQFNDVKPRPKHFHCRCPTHASLMAKIELAKHNPRERAEYDMLLRVHHQECKFWRNLESELQCQARTNPDKATVISYDDTSSMGFPRLTNRTVKNYPNDRVFMTPLNVTNHGTGENVYFYDFKNKWLHGADRMVTILYHVLYRIKTKPDAEATAHELGQKRCTTLYLMADNAGLNKNNTVLAFVSELVMRGWYQEVQMLFGPVGHTHNGNDAVHYVHNQICGNFDSITPAELFQHYAATWKTEAATARDRGVPVQLGRPVRATAQQSVRLHPHWPRPWIRAGIPVYVRGRPGTEGADGDQRLSERHTVVRGEFGPWS